MIKGGLKHGKFKSSTLNAVRTLNEDQRVEALVKFSASGFKASTLKEAKEQITLQNVSGHILFHKWLIELNQHASVVLIT